MTPNENMWIRQLRDTVGECLGRFMKRYLDSYHSLGASLWSAPLPFHDCQIIRRDPNVSNLFFGLPCFLFMVVGSRGPNGKSKPFFSTQVFISTRLTSLYQIRVF